MSGRDPVCVVGAMRRLLAAWLLILSSAGSTAAAAELSITAPMPWQVLQREGFVPQFAHDHHPGGPALGFADVEIRLSEELPADAVYEYRVQPVAGDAAAAEASWRPLSVQVADAGLRAVVRQPAGGWYRLEVRARQADSVLATAAVEPFGIGEVFIVAGQSYATNCNDERLQVQDPARRVAAWRHADGTWQVAHDPQPAGDTSDGGSIWPAFGDLLLPSLRVPVGLANVAVGGTSTAQWLPDGPLHARLVAAGRSLGRFRAVLWQQGESDVIGQVTTADYVSNLQRIRAAAVEAWQCAPQWQCAPPWLLARSTLHPTVYNDPAGEGRIRRGLEQLCEQPGFLRGPDTDVLSGENRGGPGTRRHFSGAGQRNAAALWFAAVQQYLSLPRPEHELVLPMLPQLHLLEPAWQAAVVHRESCVLLQLEADGPLTARLAFPAAEILEVATADGRVRFAEGREYQLSDDRRTLTWLTADSVAPIRAADFFPPQDAPQSYRHRAGHPEQNLLYAPGKWFHERNLEVTYRRRVDPNAAPPQDLTHVLQEARLPRTLARLRAAAPLRVGISGDSISTGLDASALSGVAPWQPGYPDLVAAQLQASSGSPVTLVNRAVSGWSVANGVQDAETLLQSRPNLVIIAYGMNDVGRRDPQWFRSQTELLIQKVRAVTPDAEIILVAPMLGHREWVHTPREMFAQYRDQLQSLTGPGIALADLSLVWEQLLQHKHDLDLTGNGLNHPNDFGHRLYAQAVLSLLLPATQP